MLNVSRIGYNPDSARSTEHTINKISTLAGLSALVSTPYLIKKVTTANPIATAKVEYKVEKGIEKTTEYVNKTINSEKGKIIISYAKNILEKIKGNETCQNTINKINVLTKKLLKNKIVQNLTTKISEYLNKYERATRICKGKMALVMAGIGLLAYSGYKLITNFYKKEGAIDQKYKDMEVMNKLLA